MLIQCLSDIFICCLHFIVFMINSIEDHLFPLLFQKAWYAQLCRVAIWFHHHLTRTGITFKMLNANSQNSDGGCSSVG